MGQEHTAKQILTLWETKRDDMMTGDMDTALLADLVKAAQVGGKPKVKFLAFKSLSKTGKRVMNVLAEPADAYVKPGSAAKPTEKPRSSW